MAWHSENAQNVLFGKHVHLGVPCYFLHFPHSFSSTNYHTILRSMAPLSADNLNIDPRLLLELESHPQPSSQHNNSTLPGSTKHTQACSPLNAGKSHLSLCISLSHLLMAGHIAASGTGPIRNNQRSHSVYAPCLDLPTLLIDSQAHGPHTYLQPLKQLSLAHWNSVLNLKCLQSAGLKVTELKELCRTHSLLWGGKKMDLVCHLQEHDDTLQTSRYVTCLCKQ